MGLKLLLLSVVVYTAVLAAVFFGQTALLFPTWAVSSRGAIAPEAEGLELLLPSGERLSGVYIPAAEDDAGPVILGFGGNAWNGADVAHFLRELFPRSDVAAFHYRGYAPSEGRPSADALIADAPLVHDLIAARAEGRPVVAVGFSVGAGVAAALAARRALAGVILVTPFDSLGAVASDHYPWLPVSRLFAHRMEPASELRDAPTPVAIIAAEHDTVVGPARTQALREAVANLVFSRTIPGAGHNDLYARPDFAEAMRGALAEIAAQAVPREGSDGR